MVFAKTMFLWLEDNVLIFFNVNMNMVGVLKML